MICRSCKCSYQRHGSPYYFLCKPCLKRERGRVKEQNRRKNKKNTLRFSMWMDCLMIHGFSCRFCENKPDVLDHIVSFYNGGSNRLSNLQPLCTSCDKKKTKIETLLQSPNNKKFKQGVELLDSSREYFTKIDFAA